MSEALYGWVGYIIFLTVSTAIFALFSLGLNLQWGLTGLINFGLVAFMSVGAYTTVLLSLNGVTLIVAALAGALVAALLGLLIGISTLRLREDYLAIVTIGVSELIRLVVNNQELPTGNGVFTPGAFGLQGYALPLVNFEPNLIIKLIMIGILTVITGVSCWQLWRWIGNKGARGWGLGDRGRGAERQGGRGAEEKIQSLIRLGKFGGTETDTANFPQNPKSKITLPLASRLILGIVATVLILVVYGAGVIGLYNYANFEKAGLMLLSLLVLALVVWRLEFLARSPWGRVLKSIREDEEVARALGKNVFWYKLQSLMLGGAIAGLAGALYAWQQTSIYPSDFDPLVTFNAWIMVVLGGTGNNFGTILGTVIYFAYDSITRFVLPGIVPLDQVRLSAFRIMVIGLILMLLMIWRPQGILGNKEELTLGK